MADITITLLTPISVRLSWTGGNGDYEVWWKSSNPAGQDYNRLASVTGTSYDVGALSWTMTYYFKVRQVGGAFGDPVEIFVCCGQAVIVGAPGMPPGLEPPPSGKVWDFWQQSADPCDGKVALSAIWHDRYWAYIWIHDGSVWNYSGRAFFEENGHPYDPAWYSSMAGHYPPAVRFVGEKIIILYAIEFDGWYGWYRLVRRDSPANDYAAGGSFTTFNTGPNPWTEYYDTDFFRERWLSAYSVPYSLEFNANGRVAILQTYIDYSDAGYDPVADDWPFVASLSISNDFGNSFGADIPLFSSFIYRWDNPHRASMTETSDGVLWIALCYYDPEGIPSYTTRDLGIKPIYKIFKYSGGAVSLARTITTDLLNTWQLVAPWNQLSWDDATAHCLVYAEGTMLVACYNHGFTQVNWDALGCDYGYNAKYNVHADISGLSMVRVDISHDSGSSWVTKEVSFGETIYCHPEYQEIIPAMCVANGVIIIYLLVGNGTETDPTAVGRRIIRSTDDGDTWSVVENFAGIDAWRLPWIMTLRSDGAHVVFTGCLACKTDYTGEPPMALWESLDAGATWAAVEVIPSAQSLILAPA